MQYLGRRAIIFAVAVIAPIAASCSATGEASGSNDPPAPPVFLVDELLSGAESPDSHVARETAVHTCMIRQGFEYEQNPFDAGVNGTGRRVNSREFREEFGYGLSIDVGAQEQTSIAVASEDFAAYLSAMSIDEREQYDAAFGECFLEAQETIDRARATFVESLPSDARDLLESAAAGLDPAFVEIEEAWSRCMAESGYAHGGSAQTFAFLSEELARVSATAGSEDDEELQQLERAIAVADLDCAAGLDGELDARRRELDDAIRSSVGTGSIYD